MSNTTLSTNEKSTQAIVDALMAADGQTRSHESIESSIRTHADTTYIRPETRSNAEAAEIFTKAANEEKMVEPFSRTFNFRPWDMALAIERVSHKLFGHKPFSVAGETQQITVPVSYDNTTEVQWGITELPELKAKIHYDTAGDQKLGMLGAVTMVAPKKLHPAIRAFLKMVDEDLAQHSIYKGKAITSENMPKFLNPYVTNREHIVWSKSVDAAMRGALLNPIVHTARARERGVKLHRSVLLFGEPGNGKSESINIVAQTAVEHGWTYVMTTTSLREALQTARLLAPSVIAAEDFERLVASASDDERNELLEELDGTTSKGREIMLVTTTNFIEDLYQAARRRMFKEIEFGPLDVDGIERFLKLKLVNQASDDLDYRGVALSLEGWGNSYISKVVDFATSLALEHGLPQLRTQDLLDSVEAQRPDWEGYLDSKRRPEPNKLDEALGDLIMERVQRLAVNSDQFGQMPLVTQE